MTENWKAWEGRVVDGRIPISQYLGSGERSAAFATAIDDRSIPNTAIKLVETGPDAEARLARWESASGLSHPHLLRLFEAGRSEADGADFLYLVMERADDDLSQVIAQRPLSARETLDILEPALDALTYLHAQGLAHGRVKPSNFLAVGDQLKLASDSIAPAGSRNEQEKTDAYAAPEQAVTGATPATDVWSLGVTMVEALTQHPGAIPPHGLAPPLDAILRGCLERDPGRRWSVARIQARLHPAAKPHRIGSRWGYAAAVAVMLAAAGFVMGPRLAHHQAEVQAVPTPQVEVSPAAPKPAPMAPRHAAPAGVTVERPGAVVHRAMPDLLPSAERGIRGKVKVGVKIHVDRAGDVERTQLVSAGPSRYFSGKALEAARKWRFSPGAASEWILHFEFSRAGTSVRPERIGR